jgi:hypothetical protein
VKKASKIHVKEICNKNIYSLDYTIVEKSDNRLTTVIVRFEQIECKAW